MSRLDAAAVAALAAVGPYTVVRDGDGRLVVRWAGLPDLHSPLGPFGLEFDADSAGLVGHRYPHRQMFDRWAAWKARHAELSAEIAVAVGLEAEAVGPPADQVAEAWVVVTQFEDGPFCCYYTVGARVLLRAGRRVECELDERTGRLKFR